MSADYFIKLALDQASLQRVQAAISKLGKEAAAAVAAPVAGSAGTSGPASPFAAWSQGADAAVAANKRANEQLRRQSAQNLQMRRLNVNQLVSLSADEVNAINSVMLTEKQQKSMRAQILRDQQRQNSQAALAAQQLQQRKIAIPVKAQEAGAIAAAKRVEQEAGAAARINEAMHRKIALDTAHAMSATERVMEAQQKANALRQVREAGADNRMAELARRHALTNEAAATRVKLVAEAKAEARAVEQARRGISGVSAPSRVRRIHELQDIIDQSGPVQAALARLQQHMLLTHGSMDKVGASLARGALDMRSLGAAALEASGRMAIFAAGGAAVFALINILGQVKTAALDANEGINQLHRVIAEPVDNAAASQKTIALMRELNVSTADTTNAAYEMGKVFHDQNQAFDAARAILLATKVAEVDVTQGSQQLIAVTNAYGLSAKGMTSVVDKLNQEQNKLGVALPKTLMAVSRSAAVVKTAAGDLDPLIARVGVLQRLSGFAPETVARQQARLAQSILNPKRQEGITEALQGKVSLFDRKGEVRSLDAILKDVGERWDTFNKLQKAKISTAFVGGEAGGLSTLTNTMFSNWSKVEEQINEVESATNGVGSAQKELNVVLRSTREQMREITVEIQVLGANIAQTGLLTVFGVLTRILAEMLEIVNDLLGAFNKLPETVRTVASTLLVVRGIMAAFSAGRVIAPIAAGAAMGSPVIAGAVNAARGGESAAVSAATVERAAAAEKLAGTEARVAIESLAVSRHMERMAAAISNLTSSAQAGAEALQITTAEHVAALDAEVAAEERAALAAASRAREAAAQAPLLGSKAIGLGLGLSFGGIMAGDMLRQGAQAGSGRAYAGSIAQGAGYGATAGMLGGPYGIAIGGAVGALTGIYMEHRRAIVQASDAFGKLTAATHNLRVAEEKRGSSLSSLIGDKPKSTDLPPEQRESAAKRYFSRVRDRHEETLKEIAAEERKRDARIAEEMSQNQGVSSADRSRYIAAVRKGQDDVRALPFQLLLKASEFDVGNFLEESRKVKDFTGNVKTGHRWSTKNLGERQQAEKFVRERLRMLGYEPDQIDKEVSAIRRAMVQEIYTNEGDPNGRGRHARSGYDAVRRLNGVGGLYDQARIQEQVLGVRTTPEQQADVVKSLYDDLNKMYVSLSKQAGDPEKVKDAQEAAQIQLEHFKRHSDEYAGALGLSEEQFLKTLNDAVRTKNVDAVIHLLGTLKAARASLKREQASNTTINILGSDESSIDDIAVDEVKNLKDAGDTISRIIGERQLGIGTVEHARKEAVAQVLGINQLAHKPANEEDRGKMVQTALQANQNFLQWMEEEVKNIKDAMDAGEISKNEGMNRLLGFLAPIANEKRLPKPIYEAAIREMHDTVEQAVTTQLTAYLKGKREEIKLIRDKDQKQYAQRRYNQTIRTIKAAAKGNYKTSGEVIKALRELEVSEDVIAAIMKGSVTASNRARQAFLRAQIQEANAAIKGAHTTLGAAAVASVTGAAVNAGYKEYMHATQVSRDVIKKNSKELASLTNQKDFSPDITKAISDALKSIDTGTGGLGALGEGTGPEDRARAAKERAQRAKESAQREAERKAEEAKREAEEARQNAQDLVEARYDYLKALAGDDDIKVARLDLKEAKELQRFAQTAAEKLRAKAAVVNAQRALREAIIGTAEGKSFGIPTEITLPTAFEVKAAAARGARRLGKVGVGEPVGGTVVHATTHNKNEITINVKNAADLKKVQGVIRDATKSELQRNRNIGSGVGF